MTSETCGLDLIGATYVRDVEPGEVVIINQEGLKSVQAFPAHERRAFCIFEYVYFARPDSNLNQRNVYRARVEMGRQLAREHPIAADIVVPVPDSGNCAALGYSLESNVPYEMAFVRNHYVGRSFLQPSQLIRDFAVRVKLNLVGELVKGKRVIIVDDSIVRGTTCKTRVNSLKEAGAKEVHVLVSCPPHMHPCVYGIDFPDRSKLMAVTHSLEEIRQYLAADSLHYLSQDGMVAATEIPTVTVASGDHSLMEIDVENGSAQIEHRNAPGTGRIRPLSSDAVARALPVQAWRAAGRDLVPLRAGALAPQGRALALPPDRAAAQPSRRGRFARDARGDGEERLCGGLVHRWSIDRPAHRHRRAGNRRRQRGKRRFDARLLCGLADARVDDDVGRSRNDVLGRARGRNRRRHRGAA